MPKRTQSYQAWRLSKLADPINAASYLNAAMQDSPEMFLKALRNAAQARQMAKVARKAGVTRESLYRATSEIGNPTLDTLGSVLKALGLKMEVHPTAESSFYSAPPTPAVRVIRGLSASRVVVGRRSSRTRHIDASGAQIPFNFSSPVPTLVQQAVSQRIQPSGLGNAAINETLLPAYLSNSLLERNYGYSGAVNGD